MAKSEPELGALLERLREFDRVATTLAMPLHERLGILNVSEEIYNGLRSGHRDVAKFVKPELERRLSYALPLMRRLASNSPGLRAAQPSPAAAA